MATKTKKETKKIVSSDDAMEEPMTKDYTANNQEEAQSQQQTGTQNEEVFIQIKEELEEALTKTVGELGYNREIGSPEAHIQVFQIFEVIEKTKGKYLTENQANQFISMIARAPYNVIADLMKDITDNQAKYFLVRTRSDIEAEMKKNQENK